MCIRDRAVTAVAVQQSIGASGAQLLSNATNIEASPQSVCGNGVCESGERCSSAACGDAGSCHGGDPAAAFAWIKNMSDKTGSGIAYETNKPYLACSEDSKDDPHTVICKNADFSCNALNTARTCPTFGEPCVGVNRYPNATVADWGSIQGVDALKKELYNRGPIALSLIHI